MDPYVRRYLATLRRWALPVPLLGGIAIFAYVLNGHIAIENWLFWRFAIYWMVAAVFSLACVASGIAVLRALRIRDLDFAEEVVLGFASGLLLFGLVLYAGGFLGVLRPWFFVAVPLALIALGIGGLVQRICLLRLSSQVLGTRPVKLLAWQLPFLFFGFLSLVAIYFACITPDNVSFDSRFYHLSLSEHYVVEGAIRATPEGWWAAAVPHMASVLYMWAFGLPTTILFDRIELAMHLEYTIFLWTLAGLPCLVRRLVPGASTGWVWVVTFLFPGLFLYDSSLSLSADHITAFWAVPVFITLLMALRDLRPSTCALLAVMLAGATLTKYQAVYFLPFPALAMLVRGLWLLWRDRQGGLRGLSRSHGWRGPMVVLLTVAALTTPHWLKNWVFYGDPLYPFLHQHFNDHPWTPDSAYLLANNSMIDKTWQTLLPPMDKLRETLPILATFSFKPHDYAGSPSFHGKLPVFGSLFTLLALCLPFVPARARLWGLFVAVHMGVFVWYWTYHVDRYLQVLLPWMVAATASVMILAWRSGWLSRVALSLLVALQLMWGSDVYFFPTHAMVGSPIKATMDLVISSFRGRFTERFNIYQPYTSIGNDLPKDAKVYLRKIAIHLGIARMTVSDYGGFGISLGRLKSLQEINQFLRGMGVTHLMWTGDNANGDWWDNLSADLIFYRLARRNTENLSQRGMYSVAALGPVPPGSTENDEKVLYLGCPNGLYRAGIYERTQLVRYPAQTEPSPEPVKVVSLTEDKISAALGEVAYIVYASSCQSSLPTAVYSQFELVARRDSTEYWLRRPEKVDP